MLGLIALLGPPPAHAERIVAVDNYVFGYTVGGKWRSPDEGFAHGRRAATFRPFGLGTVGGAPTTLGFELTENEAGTVLKGEDMRPLLAGGVPRAPRRVRTERPSAPYEAACRRFLATKGIRVAKARVTRVLRVDLDGDGTDETLVVATSGAQSYEPGKGKYSLVLLRSLRGGRVVETALEMSPNEPGGFLVDGTVRAVADLDGDGRMEVVTTIAGIDTAGARLWAYRAGLATMLAEGGVGA